MGNDILIRNKELRAISGLDCHVTRAKCGHPTVSATYLNDVSWFDGFVEQQHHAAEQIGYRPLKPSPMPTPSAPVNRANVDKSTPMLVSDRRIARLTSVVLSSLPSNTRARGVICETRVIRRSNTVDTSVAAHSRTVS